MSGVDLVQDLARRVERLEAMAHPPVDLLATMREVVTGVAEPRGHADSMVQARFIVVRQPGCAPEKKRPWVNSHEGVVAMLRELVACRPAATDLTVVELTTDGDVWFEDGRETLAVEEHVGTARRVKCRPCAGEGRHPAAEGGRDVLCSRCAGLGWTRKVKAP